MNKIHLKEYKTGPKFDNRFFVNMSCKFETVLSLTNTISGLRIVQNTYINKELVIQFGLKLGNYGLSCTLLSITPSNNFWKQMFRSMMIFNKLDTLEYPIMISSKSSKGVNEIENSFYLA